MIKLNIYSDDFSFIMETLKSNREDFLKMNVKDKLIRDILDDVGTIDDLIRMTSMYFGWMFEQEPDGYSCSLVTDSYLGWFPKIPYAHIINSKRNVIAWH